MPKEIPRASDVRCDIFKASRLPNRADPGHGAESPREDGDHLILRSACSPPILPAAVSMANASTGTAQRPCTPPEETVGMTTR